VYLLYSLLLALAALVLLPYWLIQGLRHGKYLSNIRERLWLKFPSLSKLPMQHPGTIWIHGVSVGEALSSITLARQLKETYPGRPLVVSTTTITGQTLAREKMPFADAVIYFPLDWAFCVRRALKAVRPAIVMILETEIWPRFLREAGRNGIPVIFVSGRISHRSFARYERYLGWFGGLLRPFLRNVLSNARAFVMQTERDAERVRMLGAPPERVCVGGNLKYDQELPSPTALSKWLEAEANRHGRSPLIIAGSVVATEEPLALIAFGVLQGEFPRALLVLAPRKPERFEAAAEFIRESRRKFMRRSQLPSSAQMQGGDGMPDASIPEDVSVILLDSIGELASLYRIADGVFIGGSLVSSGGHNILEPAAFGKIAVFGPSMENFSDVASRFLKAGAALQVESPEDVGVAWIELFRNPERQSRMSENAKRLVESNRGATSRALSMIAEFLSGAAR
jgi:3-deoxy-D-manno-octulosonic-acid transferase